MSGSNWRLLQPADRQALTQARLNAHFAAQWLARTARAFIPERPSDGHTNLGWDEATGGLRTHRLPDGSRLALKIADLTLELQNPAGPAPMLALDGRTDADVRAWLGPLVSAKTLDARRLDAPSPYEMPAHALGGGARYARIPALQSVAVWYGNANAVLAELRQGLVSRGLDAPPVRLWPHHFDLDTLVSFAATGGSMGAGSSPGDEYYDEPYFYVSIHPAPDVATLPPLPAIGHWHRHDFTGAVATASRIVSAKDQGAEVTAFLQAAAAIVLKALS